MPDEEVIEIAAGDATARIALRGAEPLSWRVEGRELLWHGDPAHWDRRAPILFPVIGASAGGKVRLGPQDFPMPKHGFARDSRFELVEREAGAVRLKLVENDETWTHYPFRFALEVIAGLDETGLSLDFEVTNTDTSDMPYALGFHPAFRWPFDGGEREDHAVVFEVPENPEIPAITREGLLRPGGQTLPFEGTRLRLDPALFQEALVFLEAKSRVMRFTAPSGAEISMMVEDFPHLAVWSRPEAPFLSLECWTGHADREGFSGDLLERASMIVLPMGHTMRHAVTLGFNPAP